MENINRGVDDAFYRYKMPKLQSKIEGNGNGIKTVVPNIKEIAKALDRSPNHVTKFFGFELGAQTIMDEAASRYIINGAHQASKLAEILDVFIKKYVLCSACGNPETDVILKKKGKNVDVVLTCKACGRTLPGDSTHKIITYMAKNPWVSEKKAGPRKKEEATKEKSEDSLAGPEGSGEGLSEGVSNLKIKEKEKEKDPGEIFASIVLAGEKTGIELALEASKLDLPEDLAAAVIVQVLLEQNIAQELKKHAQLFKDFVKTDKAQKGLLGGIERLVGVTHPDLLPKTPQIIKLFYDLDILEEEVIFAWFEKPSKKFAGDKDLAKKIRDAAAPLVEWLKNAEEESEDDE